MGSRRGVARLLSDERDGCAPPLQPQAHRGQHLGPLSALVEALPAELGAPDLRRYDVLDRLLYCYMGRDVQVWDSTGSLLLLGPLPLGQLLVGPLHVAATYVPGSPALRRRRVDLGARRVVHHRPALRRALRLLRLGAPPHRQHARLPPPLQQPPLLPCCRGDGRHPLPEGRPRPEEGLGGYAWGVMSIQS